MELGVFVKCPHPEMIEALGIASVDFAVVDMEHTPLGPRDLYPLVLAAERRELRLVVRIPENAPHWFKWVLDLGVREIQVPDVRSTEDAMRALDASAFSPHGKRGLCRFTRAANFSSMPQADYLNASAQLIFQVEHASNNINKLLVNGNSILIGPYDLSASMGMPGDIWNPAVTGHIGYVIECCKLSGIPVGIFTDTPDGIEHWRKVGVDFIEYGSDLQLLMGAARDLKQWSDHVID